jgi:hypothetical protein
MIKNLGFRILKSRWRKEEDFAKERMKICNVCEFNTKNIEKITIKQKVVNFFSNILTLFMTGKLNDDNSACSICSCTLTFKVLEIDEKCDKNRWDSIYIPNSAQKNKKQWK